MKKDEYMEYVDEGVKDFNIATGLKDSFIQRELDKLERVVDKTSHLPEYLRKIAFKGINDEVKQTMKEQAILDEKIKDLTQAKVGNI